MKVKVYATYMIDPMGDYTPSRKIESPKPGGPLYEPNSFEAKDMEDAFDIAKEWIITNPFMLFGKAMKFKEIIIFHRDEIEKLLKLKRFHFNGVVVQ